MRAVRLGHGIIEALRGSGALAAMEHGNMETLGQAAVMERHPNSGRRLFAVCCGWLPFWGVLNAGRGSSIYIHEC